MNNEWVYFVELEHWPHLRGRINVLKLKKVFWVEVAIVLKDSQKIYRDLGTFEISHAITGDDDNAVSLAALEGRQKLFQFLAENRES
jgi:hypothetical protein